MVHYIVFDCETTGLDNDCNLLTAFFVILDENLNKIDTLGLHIKHIYYKLYTNAIKVNNINLIEHEKNALYPSEAKEKLISFLQKNQTKKNKFIPIGHNINFDIGFLKSNLIGKEYSFYFYHIPIDTLVLSQFFKTINLLPTNQSLSLVNLCKHFDIKIENGLDHHTSEYDTLCTIELFKILCNLHNPNSPCKKRKIDELN